MPHSFLQQAYITQSNSPSRDPRSLTAHINSNEWSPPAAAKRRCILSSPRACVLGLLVGVLLGSIALATTLTLWLTQSSANNANLNGSSTTSTTGAAMASTIPVTPSTTSICSTINGSSITAAPGSTILFSMNSPCTAVSTYFPVDFYYIAQGSNETISFGIQNVPASTLIDNVSVVSNGIQLLCNGDFENGTQICWQGANHIQNGCGIGGSYCYSDPIVGSLDYVSQSFLTTPGALLNISFWTSWSGSGTGVVTVVTISP